MCWKCMLPLHQVKFPETFGALFDGSLFSPCGPRRAHPLDMVRNRDAYDGGVLRELAKGDLWLLR